MSQLSFLESVINWDEAQCRENAGEAIPKLLSLFQNSGELQEQIGIAKVLCLSLLPWIQLEEAQSQVIVPLASESSTILDKVLQSLQELCKGSRGLDDIQGSLEMLVELIECFVCCVKYVQGKTSNTIELCQAFDLARAGINILKGTYNHCKESGELYGDLLANISEILSELFKKAHSLQVVLLTMLERVTAASEVSREDVENLVSVCHGLFELCSVVTSLDTKLVCGLWKTLSRFSVRHKELLSADLNVDEMISYLCIELTAGYSRMIQLAPKQPDSDEMDLSQGDAAAFQRALKVAGYQMKILTYMLDNFADHLDKAERDVVHLIVTMQRYLPPALIAPPIAQSHVDDIHRQVYNGVEPMISLLITHDAFAEAVISAETDVGSDDWLPLLLIMVKVLDFVPQQTDVVQDIWLGPGANGGRNGQGRSVLDCLFGAVQECYTELSAPVLMSGVASGGRPVQLVSLYQYVCSHLCGLIGCFPARHFPGLEMCLLEHILSGNGFVSSLATDGWCYMARFGTADLCYQHTELLVQTYIQLEKQNIGAGQPLLTLIRRLVKFLAPEHQEQLLKRFMPRTKPCMWRELPISVFPEGSRQQICDAVWRDADDAAQRFLKNSRKNYGDLQDLWKNKLKMLKGASKNPDYILRPRPKETQSFEGLNVFLQGQESHQRSTTGFLNTYRQLWSVLAGQWQTDQYFRALLAEMLMLAAHLVQYLEEQDILMILKQLPVPPEDNRTKLSVIKFLLNISKIQFAPNPELSQTMSRVPQLFKALLTDNHGLVHHVAVDSFTQFAENTPYEALVPQCLGDDQTLQDTVVAYLNKVPHTSQGFDNIEYLKQLQTTVKDISTREMPTNNHGDILDMIRESEEPVSKRKRTDDTEKDSDVSAILGDLHKAVSRLETFRKTVTVSTESKEELQCINSRLKTVIDSL